ncbi:hypothetical protein FB451DRAFT_1183944 [Mycena latifolia]|nr:hypothetical protein FB451DRAFT_1183944 [Mycena latifolia]
MATDLLIAVVGIPIANSDTDFAAQSSWHVSIVRVFFPPYLESRPFPRYIWFNYGYSAVTTTPNGNDLKCIMRSDQIATPAPMNQALNRELWLRIFSYIVDAKALKAVVLTSRAFHNLGPVVRPFNSGSENEGNANPCSAGLDRASLFYNLRSLSLANGVLPVTFYHVLLNPTTTPIRSSVTRLSIFNSYPVETLFPLLPHLRAVKTECDARIPDLLDGAPSLTTLAITTLLAAPHDALALIDNAHRVPLRDRAPPRAVGRRGPARARALPAGMPDRQTPIPLLTHQNRILVFDRHLAHNGVQIFSGRIKFLSSSSPLQTLEERLKPQHQASSLQASKPQASRFQPQALLFPWPAPLPQPSSVASLAPMASLAQSRIFRCLRGLPALPRADVLSAVFPTVPARTSRRLGHTFFHSSSFPRLLPFMAFEASHSVRCESLLIPGSCSRSAHALPAASTLTLHESNPYMEWPLVNFNCRTDIFLTSVRISDVFYSILGKTFPILEVFPKTCILAKILNLLSQRHAKDAKDKCVVLLMQPSDVFLFALGVEPLLRLHRPHLHALPPPRPPQRRDSEYEYEYEHDADDDDDDLLMRVYRPLRAPRETRVLAVPPRAVACAEYLAVWTRYNPDVGKVRLVPGQESALRKTSKTTKTVHTSEDIKHVRLEDKVLPRKPEQPRFGPHLTNRHLPMELWLAPRIDAPVRGSKPEYTSISNLSTGARILMGQ